KYYAIVKHVTLAWELANCADPRLRDSGKAVTVAQAVVETNPHNPDALRTLGVAFYRSGEMKHALDYLAKAVMGRYGIASSRLASGDVPLAANSPQELVCEMLFLAMAHWQDGQKELARGFFERATAWVGTRNDAEIPEELRRFFDEARELIELSKEP